MDSREITNRYFEAGDGLRLHYIDVAPRNDKMRAPAICLPGLARTADDFRPLAQELAQYSTAPRRVLAFDYRGRGRSDRDPDWRRYSLEVERADLLKILGELGIASAHFIGTSRGGLHILGLAESSVDLIQSAVFNDIGPVLEPAGLARIKGYVGKTIALKSLDEAIAFLKSTRGHFSGLSEAGWRHFAETTFGSDEKTFDLRYDPQLARTLDAFDLDKPLPDSWKAFDKLKGLPVLTIRGENSDLLSETTLAAMGSRWPGSQTMTVPGQGHAPLLVDKATMSRVDSFLAAADLRRKPV